MSKWLTKLGSRKFIGLVITTVMCVCGYVDGYTFAGLVAVYMGTEAFLDKAYIGKSPALEPDEIKEK